MDAFSLVYILMSLGFALSLAGGASQYDTVIQKNNRLYVSDYLKQYPNGSVASDRPAEVVHACFQLTMHLVHEFKHLFEADARYVREAYEMREDDALNLFFYGTLVCCVVHMRTSVAVTYQHMTEQRQILSLLETQKELFQRTATTPLLLPNTASHILELGAAAWRSSEENSDSSIRSTLVRFFKTHRIDALEGQKGYWSSCLLLAIGLGAVSLYFFAVSFVPSAAHRYGTAEHFSRLKKRSP